MKSDALPDLTVALQRCNAGATPAWGIDF